jgi:sentrin-specific protease 7
MNDRKDDLYEKSATRELDVLFFYPPIGSDPITVRKKEIDCLNDGGWLNDSVIQFYLKYLENNKLLGSELSYIFSTFFYVDLTKGANKSTGTVDIFSYNYLIIPVNVTDSHWYLAIIYNPGAALKNHVEVDRSKFETACSTPAKKVPINSKQDKLHYLDSEELKKMIGFLDAHENSTATQPVNGFEFIRKEPEKEQEIDLNNPCHIMILDSLVKNYDNHHDQAIRVLKDFLQYEARMKKNVTIDTKAINVIKAKVPQQKNNSDCGVFILQFVETFFQDSRKYVDIILDDNEDLNGWFTQETVSKKRKIIQDLLNSMVTGCKPFMEDFRLAYNKKLAKINEKRTDEDLEIIERTNT